jgi:hypothetical protein
MATDTEPIDVDTAPDEREVSARAIAVRSPQIPVTLSELAALKGEATAIIEARVQVIETLRRASIRATSPPDWVLHKAPDEAGGQIVGYLQDAGADRVRDLWGIEVYDVSTPEKVAGVNPEEYHYIVTGSGRCKLTRQTIEQMEGGRSSTDEFCKDRHGLERELLVRKAARANLDGGITRELAGMKSVPVEDLKAAWVGTTKQVEQCRLGRGFGTRNQRVGGRDEKAPDVDPPVCPHCKSPGVYRPAKDNRKPFYGCPKYATHPTQKFIVDVDEWVAKQTRTAAPAPAAAASSPASAPLTANDIPFGREPGQEG